jgi:hypothetical protein
MLSTIQKTESLESYEKNHEFQPVLGICITWGSTSLDPDPDAIFHFDADPNSACSYDLDSDSEPSFQAQNHEKVLNWAHIPYRTGTFWLVI